MHSTLCHTSPGYFKILSGQSLLDVRNDIRGGGGQGPGKFLQEKIFHSQHLQVTDLDLTLKLDDINLELECLFPRWRLCRGYIVTLNISEPMVNVVLGNISSPVTPPSPRLCSGGSLLRMMTLIFNFHKFQGLSTRTGRNS